MKTDEKCMSIKFKGGGEFINPPSPEKVLTLLAELLAKQEGRVAKDIKITKKEAKTA